MRYLGFKYPKTLLVIILFITAVCIYLLPKIQIDNDIDVYFDKKSQSFISFEDWKEEFGADEIVVVAFKSDDIFKPEPLRLIQRLTESFESLKYVRKVTSLTNVNDVIGLKEDFIVRPLIEEIPVTYQQLQDLKKRALANPLYIKDIISEDAKTAGIFIELDDPADIENDIYKKETINSIKEILRKEFSETQKYYISGGAAVEHFYTLYTQEDLKKFFPLIISIVFFILLFTLRSASGVIASLLTVLISISWTMAFLYLCGFSINSSSAIIPPIIMALAVADSIHLITEYAQRRKKN